MQLNNAHAPIQGRDVDGVIRTAHVERSRAIRTLFSGLFGSDRSKARSGRG